MPTFLITTRDRSGRSERSKRDGASSAAVVEAMRAQGLLVLEVKMVAAAAAGQARSPGSWFMGQLFPPRTMDVEISLQQLAFMLRSGLPLLAALRTSAAQAQRRSMGQVWERVAERIQEGMSLSSAMAEHPCFPHLAVTMARVGEETGILDQVLNRAASAMERRRVLLGNLSTALAYPAIVVLMSIGVVAYMMLGLIPKLQIFLAASGRKLPPLTQLLVDLSLFFRTYWLHLGVGVIVLMFALYALGRWRPAGLLMDRALLRLPLLGPVFRLAATATFARGLGTMLACGVRLTEALRIVQLLHRNRYILNLVEAARERVLQGAPLAAQLATPGAFMPMLSSMVAVGETSGTLDEVLGEVAGFHESRLEAVIRRLSAILEPLIIVVVGGIVGFIYLAFFMAIYAMLGKR